MMRALRTAATGMEAQQRKIDTTANNIANANTTGFKNTRAEFQELMYQQLRAPQGQQGGQPVGVEVGLGVKTAATSRNFSQGTLTQTENPLDLAIEGRGFFRVRTPQGQEAYTRSGTFKLDANGQVVTTDGLQLLPNITIPPDATQVSVQRDGRVSVLLPNNEQPIEVGQIDLVSFANPAGLTAQGRGLYSATASSGQPQQGLPGQQGLGEVSQGFLEGSNVQIVEEMIDMIVAQRSYEINSKVIRTADEMLRAVTTLR